MTQIILKHGTNDKVKQYTGSVGEIIVDDTNKQLVSTTGKEYSENNSSVSLSSNPTKLSQFTNDTIWTSANLTKVSQLSNDVFISKTNLTKLSQLSGTSPYKTGYCTYCSYCNLCVQCRSVDCNFVATHNCLTVNCTTNTYKCSQVKCTDCSYDANQQCND